MNKEKTKHFYAVCDVGEGIPSYNFVVTAQNISSADKKVRKILKADYPENWEYNQNDYSVEEITANKLLAILTIA